jgi:type IV pilus assembly protein PilA
MHTALRQRFGHDDESGFTLIELMVVVLIIGILLAIAIPTFLGARNRASDRSAQSNLRNALTAEKTLYTDNEKYTSTASAGPPSGISLLQGVEPSLTWVVAASSYANRNVSAVTPNPQSVILATQSATGTCWFILDIATPAAPSGTFYAQNTTCATPGLPTGAVTQPFSGATVGSWALAF